MGDNLIHAVPFAAVVAGSMIVLYALRNLLAGRDRLRPSSPAGADHESTDTPAVPPSDRHWHWAKRMEIDQKIAEAALRKQEAEAINALEQDGLKQDG